MYSKGGGGGGVGGTGVFVPEKKKEKKGGFLKDGERCNKIKDIHIIQRQVDICQK